MDRDTQSGARNSLFPLQYVVALLIFSLSACHHTAPSAQTVDFHKPLPEGMVALRKIPIEEYPDFSRQPIDPARLRQSIDSSLRYLSAPSSQAFFPYLDIGHDRAIATLTRLRKICDEVTTKGAWDPAAFNQSIRENFEVYKSYGAPAADGSGYTDRVLFTGYCTPIYDASLQRGGAYQWPLYKIPADLVRDPGTGTVSGRKTAEGQIVPYYTRGEIETGGKLTGDELVWLKSRWEAYIVTVQGSAILRLDNGKQMGVGFAAMNGYPYTSPGRQMVADGVITQDQLTLRGLGQFFTAHPEMMDKYLSLNQRTIFFTEHSGPPVGKLNVPVTAMATIATDKEQRDIYPRAMPAFLSVPIPDASGAGVRPFSGFMLDQDAGGAIRASGRCDIYMGIGPAAQAMAGEELQEGALYYLAIRMELLPQPRSGAVSSAK